MKTGEWGRLALTGLGAGLLGAALGGFLVEPREAPQSSIQPVVDMAPVEAAIRELKDVLGHASLSKSDWQRDISKLRRDQMIDDAGLSMRVPLPPAPDHAALESTAGQFVAALEAAVERLEKMADGEHRSARLVEMVEGMARVPRVPPRWPEVARLASLHGRAGQGTRLPVACRGRPEAGLSRPNRSTPGARHGNVELPLSWRRLQTQHQVLREPRDRSIRVVVEAGGLPAILTHCRV